MEINANVWLVDDDPIYRFAFVRIVQKLGLSVIIETFCNGQEAWQVLEGRMKSHQSLPPLILLDINMPIMDGWDFLKCISAIDSMNTKVLMVSSSTDPRDFQKAGEFSQVAGYVPKPMSDDMLLELLKPFSKT